MLDMLPQTRFESPFALTQAYLQDPRAGKIDVGVGMYRDEQGCTPVMAAVRWAERSMLEQQTSKSYVGAAGNLDFCQALAEVVFGETIAAAAQAVQAAGGCSAVRSLLDLVALGQPDATVWISDPSWSNHAQIASAARLKVACYPYLDSQLQRVRFDAMLDVLHRLGPRDVVLLHGACHNPTGTDLEPGQWREIGQIAGRNGFLVLIDLAYQGLGEGLEEDVFGVRHLCKVLPEVLVAVSCSKNFGLYRDRVGAAYVVGQDAPTRQLAFESLVRILRSNYSMAPDHGAQIVQTILRDPSLSQQWKNELDGMRERVSSVRVAVADHLRGITGASEFDFIRRQRGMFSLLGLSGSQVNSLRERHGVYMPMDARVNFAGLRSDQAGTFAQAVAKSLR